MILVYLILAEMNELPSLGTLQNIIINYACCHVAFGRNLRIFEVIRYLQKCMYIYEDMHVHIYVHIKGLPYYRGHI